MSSASDLSAALSAASSAATILINEKAAADRALVEATMDLNDAAQLIIDLRDVNDKLVAIVAEKDAEIARLQAIIDGDPDPDPDPETKPLAGRSASSNNHGTLTRSGLVRVYKFSAVDGELGTSGAKMVFLSDEAANLSASQLDAALKSATTKHPDVTFVWHPENEVTANDLTSSQAAAYVTKTRDQKAVTDKYPTVRMGINLTAYGVRQGRHIALKPCAEYVEVITASCYNPGRGKTPPVWDDYEDYLDPILDVVDDWGVDQFGIGEFGNPVDPRDSNKRPEYAAGAVTYVRTGCKERSIRYIGGSWWDQQKSGGPDNKLSNDAPKTADAWIAAHD